MLHEARQVGKGWIETVTKEAHLDDLKQNKQLNSLNTKLINKKKLYGAQGEDGVMIGSLPCQSTLPSAHLMYLLEKHALLCQEGINMSSAVRITILTPKHEQHSAKHAAQKYSSILVADWNSSLHDKVKSEWCLYCYKIYGMYYKTLLVFSKKQDKSSFGGGTSISSLY